MHSRTITRVLRQSLAVTPFILVSFLMTLSLAAADITGQVRTALGSSGSTGLVVLPLQPGGRSIQINPEQVFKPASVLKLLTSSTALSVLGPEYRFETSVFASGVKGSHVDHLWVRGSGDPNFRTEDMWTLARALYRKGYRSIGTLHLDETFFAGSKNRVGQRAYESGSAALALNFNSQLFEVCPGPNGKASVVVDPWEYKVGTTGAIKTVSGKGGSYSIDELSPSKGQQRFKVAGTIGRNRQCGQFYRSVADPIRYFGEVLTGFLGHLSIETGKVRFGSTVPKGLERVYVHKSKALSQIIEDLNHFSTNMIAEQLLAVLGARQGTSASPSRGLSEVRKFVSAKTDGMSSKEVLHDGSGLSHKNRVRAQTIADLLVAMHDDPGVGVEFLKSLSVAGRSGTLKKRNFEPKELVLRAKTGTINGVVSLAGYFTARSGDRYAFALLQNGVRSPQSAWKKEQAVLRKLYNGL